MNWTYIEKEHTKEYVCLNDNNVEVGFVLIEHDNSPEAHNRINENKWLYDEANKIFPEGFSMNDLKSIIENKYCT